MKLREGNVFTGICLSLSLVGVGRGRSHATITHDALDLTVQVLAYRGNHWRPVQTSSCVDPPE